MAPTGALELRSCASVRDVMLKRVQKGPKRVKKGPLRAFGKGLKRGSKESSREGLKKVLKERA